MSEFDDDQLGQFTGRELQLHDPFVLPDELELQHEIKRPRYWYAHQLRLAGATWSEIAEALGYSTGGSAHTSVKQALSSVATRQTRQEMLDLELERLDMLMLVHWRAARSGDQKATDTVLKIMTLRQKLVGLGESTGYEDEKSDSATILIGGDEDAYLDGIKRAQALHRKPIEGEVRA